MRRSEHNKDAGWRSTIDSDGFKHKPPPAGAANGSDADSYSSSECFVPEPLVLPGPGAYETEEAFRQMRDRQRVHPGFGFGRRFSLRWSPLAPVGGSLQCSPPCAPRLCTASLVTCFRAACVACTTWQVLDVARRHGVACAVCPYHDAREQRGARRGKGRGEPRARRYARRGNRQPSWTWPRRTVHLRLVALAPSRLRFERSSSHATHTVPVSHARTRLLASLAIRSPDSCFKSI